MFLELKYMLGDIQMKCVNCGASYPDTHKQCPYCGSENTKKAAEEHKNKLEWYAIKSAILKDLPRVIGKVAGKFVIKLLIVFIVGGILIALASAGIAKVKSAIAYENKDSVMNSLEVLYQAEDYEAMMKLLKQQEHYTSATYGRYYRIGELNELYQSAATDIEETLRMAEKYEDPESLRYSIKRLFRILYDCEKYEEAGYVYDEEEEVEVFRQKAEDVLREHCYLSEEEIEQGLMLYAEEEDMIEIYQLIIERYRKKQTKE